MVDHDHMYLALSLQKISDSLSMSLEGRLLFDMIFQMSALFFFLDTSACIALEISYFVGFCVPLIWCFWFIF